MISVKIDGQILDLDGDFSMQFEESSLLFDDAVAQKAFSYPIAVPMTARNRAAFGFIDRIDAEIEFKSYSCVVEIDGDILISGQFNLQTVSEAGAQGYILGEEFDTTVIDVRIKDVNMGGDVDFLTGPGITMAQFATQIVGTTVNDYDFCFPPTYNPDFFKDTQTPNTPIDDPIVPPVFNFGGIVNLWNYRLQSYWEQEAYMGGAFLYPEDVENVATQSTFVPYPYLYAVLKYAAQHIGYSLDGDFINDIAIKKLCIYNTVSLDFWEPIDGIWGSGGGRHMNNTSRTTINLINHIPDITLKELLDALKNLFNLSIKFDSREKKLWIEAKNGKLTQMPESLFDSYPLNISPNAARANVKISMTADDNDTNQTALTQYIATENILDDSTSFPSSDPNGVVRFNPATYRSLIKGSFTKTRITSALSYQNGSDFEEIVTTISTVETLRNVVFKYGYISGSLYTETAVSGIIPIARQIGNSPEYNVTGSYATGKTPVITEFSLRLLFYAGTHTDPNGFGVYPIATENIYDDNGNEILPYSLKWKGGAHSLYDSWWKLWLTKKNGKKMTFDVPLSAIDYKRIDTRKPYKIGTQHFLIKKMSTTFNIKGIQNVRIEALKM